MTQGGADRPRPAGEGYREREITLVVVSETAADLARRIGALDRLGGHRLRPKTSVRLRDTYLDTPGGDLAERGLALRVRRADGRDLLTLKGGSRSSEAGEADRLELEAPWSTEAVAEVVEALRERGVEPPGPDGREPPRPEGDPVAALEARGWRVVQERATDRSRWDLLPAGGPEPVAELAVDATRFPAGDEAVEHHELEVEAVGSGGVEVLREVAGDLRDRFGSRLLPWDHSKLAIGRAVEDLAAAGELAGLLGPDGELTLEAYRRLNDRLQERG